MGRPFEYVGLHNITKSINDNHLRQDIKYSLQVLDSNVSMMHPLF
jgi:hypothetical protein